MDRGFQTRLSDDEWTYKDLAGFALGYKGKGYKQNMYDLELKKTYEKYLNKA